MSIYRTRRSCKVPRSPRNDSLLRTVLPLQHLTHVRPAVWVSNPIDTPLVNHNIPSQPGISIYQPRPTVQLNSTTRPTSAYQHPTSSWTQRLDRPQLTSIQHLAELNDSTDLSLPANNIIHPSWRLHTTITDIYIHACKIWQNKLSFVIIVTLPLFLHIALAVSHSHNSFAGSTYLSAPQQYKSVNSMLVRCWSFFSRIFLCTCS